MVARGFVTYFYVIGHGEFTLVLFGFGQVKDVCVNGRGAHEDVASLLEA